MGNRGQLRPHALTSWWSRLWPGGRAARTAVVVLLGSAGLMGLASGMRAAAPSGDRLPSLAGSGPRELRTIPRFVDATARLGSFARQTARGCSGNVAGVAVADVNGDGRLDLFEAEPNGPSRLWVGTPGHRFRAAAGSRIMVPRATGSAFADIDDDGDEDLYVVSQGRDRMFENDGHGHFHDVTTEAGADDPGPGTSAAFADVNGDGRLDLYVADGDNCTDPRPSPDRLYQNVGGGRFRDASRLLGPTDGIGMQPTWTDVDSDGRPDLFLANDDLGFRPNALWHSTGHGFTDVGDRWGAETAMSSMGVGVGDLDGDGHMDLVVSDLDRAPRVLFNRGNRFESARLPQPDGDPRPISWGVVVADFDNDGDQDVFAAGGARGVDREPRASLLYLNDGHGRFAEASQQAGLGSLGRARGAVAADINGDGRLDLVVAGLGQRLRVLLNRPREASPQRHWLALRLRGTSSARDACGARVDVRWANRRVVDEVECGSEGLGSSDDHSIHVGVGSAQRVATIAILWPSGARQRFTRTRVDRTIEVVEPVNRSHPGAVEASDH